jgi:uncharacterized protein
LIIDVFPHVIPVKYKEALYKLAPPSRPAKNEVDKIETLPSMWDMDVRFRIMDKYDGLLQILTLGAPAIESIASSEDSPELAKIANDSMAELVNKFPDRFIAAVASLPMNNINAALIELERAITRLGCRGIQISSDINGKPLDSPEFWPIYERMTYYGLPILIHPETKPAHECPDYPGEKEAKFITNVIFRWPLQTTLAMTRLALGGVLEKYPTLKIVTHHAGAMVPFFAERIRVTQLTFEKMGMADNSTPHLSKRPIEYYKMFYVDTAINGCTPALMCSHAFFGTDHMLFGTDFPYSPQFGDLVIREGIASIQNMSISEIEKKKIFSENAKELFRLPL